MKKAYLLFLVFLTCATLKAQTVDTLFLGQREPTFYYWGTNWIDQPNFFIVSNSTGPSMATQRARHCDVIYEEGLNIIGIAAPVSIITQNPTIDTNITHRVPEYFELYKPVGDSMVLIDSVRWDTCTARYRMQFPRGNVTYFPQVMEAYFKKPIVMHDSFYISGSTHNNHCTCDEYGLPFSRYHPYTSYYIAYNNNSIEDGHQPPHIKLKCNCLCPAEIPFHDYEWHTEYRPNYGGNTFFAIFPIFDTTGMFPDTTGHTTGVDTICPPTQRLLLLDHDSEVATFAWNSGANTAWEFCLAPAGTPPDSGTIRLCESTFFTVSVSEVDTGVWYSAWVRTVCDTRRSAWSDSVLFIFHGAEQPPIAVGEVNDGLTLVAPNPAHDRVSLFSSYYIRSYELYSLSGELVERRSVHATGTTIDVSALPRGTYLLRLHTAYGESSHKIVLR